MFVKLMEEQEQRKRFEEEQKQRNMVRHLFTIDYQHLHSAMLDYVYVTDQFKTWPVLKPSDGFKAGRTASKRARRLRNGPDGFLT